ncbi:hypothetical protein COL78_04590 [Bacillus wiedmannii]|nr:hypothetical protein COL78_04590 [Bacillus wiedmannii]
MCNILFNNAQKTGLRIMWNYVRELNLIIYVFKMISIYTCFFQFLDKCNSNDFLRVNLVPCLSIEIL